MRAAVRARGLEGMRWLTFSLRLCVRALNFAVLLTFRCPCIRAHLTTIIRIGKSIQVHTNLNLNKYKHPVEIQLNTRMQAQAQPAEHPVRVPLPAEGGRDSDTNPHSSNTSSPSHTHKHTTTWSNNICTGESYEQAAQVSDAQGLAPPHEVEGIGAVPHGVAKHGRKVLRRCV